LVGGSYSYKASIASTANYNSAAADCEPFTVLPIMPLRKFSTDGSNTDGLFTFGLFIGPRVAGSPTGYVQGDADKNAVATATTPADLPVPFLPFVGSVCEIGIPSGWTFSNWITTFVPNGLAGNSASAPYEPAAESGTQIRCVDLVIVQDTQEVHLDVYDSPTLEYCSPGYWKQPQHFGSYPLSDVTILGVTYPAVYPYLYLGHPATKYGEVFGDGVVDPTNSDGDGIPYSIENLTFPEAIGLGGGGLNMLTRHSGAGYLNAMTLSYGLSPQQVLDLTNAAFLGGAGSTAFNTAVNALNALAIENCSLGNAPLPGGPSPGKSNK
jgi:hypothetical protein